MKDKWQMLVKEIGELALQQKVVMTAAESCTAGGVAYALTAIPGSSGWFEQGFITYSNKAKQSMLGVNSTTLDQFGAVSEETVLEMVEGALSRSGAGLGVAISGIAGPDGGSADKPVGTVWFAWAGPGSPLTEYHHFEGDRQSVREQAITVALSGLLARLKEN